MESMATEKEALAALESRLKDLTQLRDQMQVRVFRNDDGQRAGALSSNT